ncbi:MAG: hypothetical protein WHT81_00455 [Rectinemataceae bacterium]|nr:hypothetical protein [Spirochaetaceae bacterium]
MTRSCACRNPAFLLSALLLILGPAGTHAQTKPPSPSPQPSQGVQPTPTQASLFEFRIRTAFSLTPEMVAWIQSSMAKSATTSKGAAASPQQPAPPARLPAWEQPIVKTASASSPLTLRIQSESLVAVIAFMPISVEGTTLNLMVQNQFWIKAPDNSIQVSSSVHTVSVPLESLFYYYPLGTDAKKGAPLAIELWVGQQGR